jgi:hypothetical protein
MPLLLRGALSSCCKLPKRRLCGPRVGQCPLPLTPCGSLEVPSLIHRRQYLSRLSLERRRSLLACPRRPACVLLSATSSPSPDPVAKPGPVCKSCRLLSSGQIDSPLSLEPSLAISGQVLSGLARPVHPDLPPGPGSRHRLCHQHASLSSQVAAVCGRVGGRTERRPRHSEGAFVHQVCPSVRQTDMPENSTYRPISSA